LCFHALTPHKRCHHFPVRCAWEVPTFGANCESRFPIIQPAVCVAVGVQVIETFAVCTACLRLAVGFALVLYATNTNQVALIVVVPESVLAVVMHVEAVSAGATVLAGTPPAAVVADIVEAAT